MLTCTSYINIFTTRILISLIPGYYSISLGHSAPSFQNYPQPGSGKRPHHVQSHYRRIGHGSHELKRIMLNSPLSRSSQSSPNWHYAEPSPRITHLSRRHQSTNSNSKSQSPRPQLTNYVDVGTQWSPRTDSHPPNTQVKPEKEQVEKIAQTELPAMPTVSMANGPIPIPKPALKAESPTMKRRQSRDTTDGGPSNSDNKQEVRPKRARSASRPVKLLPARYEFCEVEDMVILIANMISELIQTNDALPLRTGVLTRFHSR